MVPDHRQYPKTCKVPYIINVPTKEDNLGSFHPITTGKILLKPKKENKGDIKARKKQDANVIYYKHLSQLKVLNNNKLDKPAMGEYTINMAHLLPQKTRKSL
jgi:hypothetical protein